MVNRYPCLPKLETKSDKNMWKIVSIVLIGILIGSNANVQAQVASTGYVISRFLDSGGSTIVNAGDSANSAVRVNIVAGSSSGTTYTEDVASAGAEVTTMAGVIREDTPATTTSATGDFTTLKSDSVGRLWTNGIVTQASANNDGACVSMTTTSATILATFATRKYASICALGATTENTDTVFIKLGATATTSDFPLRPGACWNTPAGSVYTGTIDGRSNTGTQSVCVLEW